MILKDPDFSQSNVSSAFAFNVVILFNLYHVILSFEPSIINVLGSPHKVEILIDFKDMENFKNSIKKKGFTSWLSSFVAYAKETASGLKIELTFPHEISEFPQKWVHESISVDSYLI